MKSLFPEDDHPNGPRILFIGLGQSSHTHSWIDLLAGSRFNVRMFCTSSDLPPSDWPVRTYVLSEGSSRLDPAMRQCLWTNEKYRHFVHKSMMRVRGRAWNTDWVISDWLQKIITEWKPDIVHTLGLEAAGFYFVVRERLTTTRPKWVVQTRGGSDMQLAHLDPKRNAEIAMLLRACDQMLSDNAVNFRIARQMGVRDDQISAIGPVPGTGGIDVEALAKSWNGSASQRRIILWPKAYECPWSKALPVFEALKLCWEAIQPCEIHMMATTEETRMHFWDLPETIRQATHLSDRVPRAKVLELMTSARVMLAPSLVDGTPNSMFEAMASGAFPIVSPLETIRAIVEDERNVLFARNLYPDEIAAALQRAMTDDVLVDRASAANLELVRRLADRQHVRARVLGFYERLVGESLARAEAESA
ncbi:MAG TPA: glycosyltransferase family 4 protein [Pyrinomonadaceae bacterium]|nr:glycosyltransferase family 4 protein [Pyrinomonadaceae bacterium]